MERAQHGTALIIPEHAYRWRDLQLATAGFLAMYSENTRRGHATELRLWIEWCLAHSLDPLDDVLRAHIHAYAKELEEVHGRKKSTVAHKLSVIAGFYEYCADEEILGRKNPATKLKRPKIEYITTREHLDDGELLSDLFPRRA
jgi:site-specific recombinase XerD